MKTNKKQVFSMPRMGVYTDIFKDLFENLGCEIVLPPPITRKTINLGVRNSPDMMCYPFKVTLGSMIEALNNDADSILMFENSYGTCRFRHYHTLQRHILKDLGYKFNMCPITSANLIRSVKKVTHKSTFTITRQAWKSYKQMREVEQKYYSFKQEKDKLSIGIIGEIYCVLENSINYDIINKLKKMDVNVHVSCQLSDFLKHSIKKHISNPNKTEAKKYLKFPIGGHGFQSVEHTIDYAKKGFDGIIHLLPLSCLTKDTNITVENYNFKQIKDIKNSDLVLTHKGRFKKVVQTMNRDYNGKILNIDCGGLLKLNITPEHPILAVRRNETNFEPKFIKSSELKEKDFIIVPRKAVNDYFLAPIKSINENKFQGKVYNFEVEDDNSYVANNLAVHNCMPDVTVEPIINILSKKYGIPVYRFPLDENQFDAGFFTRLDTFISLLKRKRGILK